MLLRLTPENVAKMWDLLKPAIIETLPAPADKRQELGNRLLKACLDGTLTVWVLGKHGEDKFDVYVVLTTMPYLDDPSGTWSLLIYSLAALRLTPKELWLELLKKLTEYAKKSGFSAIVAYSDSENMVSIAQKLGADVSTRFIKLEV